MSALGKPAGDGEAVSFRQAGKATAGTVIKGQLVGQRTGARNFSSIPSKFETTLFTGNKEQNAFGSRAFRFFESENDRPGPGSYEGDAIKVKDDRVYSKKGLGVGFVSKAKRASSFASKSVVPGPGNYEERDTLVNEMLEHTRYNQTASSSVFKPPSKRSVTVADEVLPGPGQYNSQGIFDAPQRAPVSGVNGDHVFRSSVFNGGKTEVPSVSSTAGPSTAPAALQKNKVITIHPGNGGFKAQDHVEYSGAKQAPGQYEPSYHTDGLKYESGLPYAAFRSGVPNAGGSQPVRMTKEQELGVVPSRYGPQPGPGDYNAFKGSFPASLRRSPEFCDSTIDRFGKLASNAPRVKPPPPPVPGPGAYHSEEMREVAPISSSAFMSGSLRETRPTGIGVPGPAYYKPDGVVPKKSYHLNNVQRWMPSV